jgi:hypothetical protein
MKLILTVGKSFFVDNKGREQRCDMLLLAGAVEEWPHVVTMFEGKLDLERDFDILLGQARRRAVAILSAQPWRKYVDIIMCDLKHIAIFRMDSDNYNYFTGPLDFLRNVRCGTYLCQQGYYLLLDYLKNPQRLGFVQCPQRLLTMRPLLNNEANASLVCGRSKDKAVFVMEVEGVRVVAKVFADGAVATNEHHWLMQVQRINGAARLHPTCAVEILHCEVGIDGVREWYGFVIQPYCSVLVPSTAQPHHFYDVAQTILAAGHIAVVCNDISSDNLLQDTATDKVYIADWGLATVPGTRIGSSGKQMYIPPTGRLEDGTVDENRQASVRSDLFALLLVSVCCALGDVPWACAKIQADTKNKMLEICGLGALPGDSRKLVGTKWEYLLDVARMLMDMERSDGQVVGAFGTFGTFRV